VLPLTTIVAAA